MFFRRMFSRKDRDKERDRDSSSSPLHPLSPYHHHQHHHQQHHQQHPSAHPSATNITDTGNRPLSIVQKSPMKRRASTSSSGLSVIQLTPLWEHIIRTRALPEDLDPVAMFEEFMERLQDPEWQVRQHALRVLIDVLIVMGQKADSFFAPVIPHLVENLGHQAPTVRKGALDALRVYISETAMPESVLLEVMDIGLNQRITNEPFGGRLTCGVMLSLPALVQATLHTSKRNYILRSTIDMLVSKMTQVTHQEVTLKVLQKIRDLIGPREFSEYMSHGAYKEFELLCDVYGLTESDNQNGRPRSSWHPINSFEQDDGDSSSNQAETYWRSGDDDDTFKDFGCSPKEKIILETEIKINDDTLTMRILERDEELLEDGNCRTMTCSDDEDMTGTLENSGIIHVLSDSELEDMNNNVTEDNDGSATPRTPKRVTFGGEIVKMRTPDSDTTVQSDVDNSNRDVQKPKFENLNFLTVEIPNDNTKPAVEKSVEKVSKVENVQQEPLLSSPISTKERTPTPPTANTIEQKESVTPPSPPRKPSSSPSLPTIPLKDAPPGEGRPKSASASPFRRISISPVDSIISPRTSHKEIELLHNLQRSPCISPRQSSRSSSRNNSREDEKEEDVGKLSGNMGESASVVRLTKTWEDLGIVDDSVLKDLKSGDWRHRLRAISIVEDALKSSDNLAKIQPCLDSILRMLLSSERNPEVIEDKRRIVMNLISRLPLENLENRSTQIITGLCRQGGAGSNRVCKSLMQRLPPSFIVLKLLSDDFLHARSSRFRENALQMVTYALMTFPSTCFDTGTCINRAIYAALDKKRRVRQASLDVLAVLGQVTSPRVVLDSVQAIARDHDDGSKLHTAVQARLARKQLPTIGPEGSVQYALRVPSPHSGDHGPEISLGADVEWIISGIGSVSPTSLRRRSQKFCHSSKPLAIHQERTGERRLIAPHEILAMGVGVRALDDFISTSSSSSFQGNSDDTLETRNASLRQRQTPATYNTLVNSFAMVGGPNHGYTVTNFYKPGGAPICGYTATTSKVTDECPEMQRNTTLPTVIADSLSIWQNNHMQSTRVDRKEPPQFGTLNVDKENKPVAKESSATQKVNFTEKMLIREVIKRVGGPVRPIIQFSARMSSLWEGFWSGRITEVADCFGAAISAKEMTAEQAFNTPWQREMHYSTSHIMEASFQGVKFSECMGNGLDPGVVPTRIVIEEVPIRMVVEERKQSHLAMDVGGGSFNDRQPYRNPYEQFNLPHYGINATYPKGNTRKLLNSNSYARGAFNESKFNDASPRPTSSHPGAFEPVVNGSAFLSQRRFTNVDKLTAQSNKLQQLQDHHTNHQNDLEKHSVKESPGNKSNGHNDDERIFTKSVLSQDRSLSQHHRSNDNLEETQSFKQIDSVSMSSGTRKDTPNDTASTKSIGKGSQESVLLPNSIDDDQKSLVASNKSIAIEATASRPESVQSKPASLQSKDTSGNVQSSRSGSVASKPDSAKSKASIGVHSRPRSVTSLDLFASVDAVSAMSEKMQVSGPDEMDSRARWSASSDRYKESERFIKEQVENSLDITESHLENGSGETLGAMSRPGSKVRDNLTMTNGVSQDVYTARSSISSARQTPTAETINISNVERMETADVGDQQPIANSERHKDTAGLKSVTISPQPDGNIPTSPQRESMFTPNKDFNADTTNENQDYEETVAEPTPQSTTPTTPQPQPTTPLTPTPTTNIFESPLPIRSGSIPSLLQEYPDSPVPPKSASKRTPISSRHSSMAKSNDSIFEASRKTDPDTKSTGSTTSSEYPPSQVTSYDEPIHPKVLLTAAKSANLPLIRKSKTTFFGRNRRVSPVKQSIKMSQAEVFPQTLLKFDRPKDALSLSLMDLDSTEWETVIVGLRSLVRMMRHHPEILDPQMHMICIQLGKAVRNLRSQVSRAACQAATELFTIRSKFLEQECDDLAGNLLHRTADTNRFLRADAMRALEAMCDHLSPQKVVHILNAKGLNHQNATVRTSTAKLLNRFVDRIGYDRVFSLGRDHRDKLLIMAGSLLMEGCLETRSYTKKLFRTLAEHASCARILKEVIPNRTYRNIEKTLKSIM